MANTIKLLIQIIEAIILVLVFLPVFVQAFLEEQITCRFVRQFIKWNQLAILISINANITWCLNVSPKFHTTDFFIPDTITSMLTVVRTQTTPEGLKGKVAGKHINIVSQMTTYYKHLNCSIVSFYQESVKKRQL